MFARMHNDNGLIGSAEAAQRLGINRATFNRWVAAGRIAPRVTMGGRTGGRLFAVEDVDRVKAEASA